MGERIGEYSQGGVTIRNTGAGLEAVDLCPPSYLHGHRVPCPGKQAD